MNDGIIKKTKNILQKIDNFINWRTRKTKDKTGFYFLNPYTMTIDEMLSTEKLGFYFLNPYTMTIDEMLSTEKLEFWIKKLGWQGGTIHQVKSECIKRIKKNGLFINKNNQIIILFNNTIKK